MGDKYTIKHLCEDLLEDIHCDFVGFAIQKHESPFVSWQIAAGNSNEKYTKINVRYAKGIAGKVIATGRAIEISDFSESVGGKALDYPIMLAEKLQYAFAVPIYHKDIPKGVLLSGNRTVKPLSPLDQGKVKKVADKVEALLSGEWLNLWGKLDG